MADWIGTVNAVDLPTLAPSLQLEVKGWGDRTLAPCPACGEHRRGKRDPRGPIGLDRSRRRWRCHRCEAGGDVVALVALHVIGSRSLSKEDWRAVRAWCADRGLCEPWEPERGRRVRRRPRPPPPPPPPPPNRPPGEELDALLTRCAAPWELPEVAAWLRSRGLDPYAVEDLGNTPLILALPRDAQVPSWAWIGARENRDGPPGHPWPRRGFQAIVGLYDADGAMRSVRARCVRRFAGAVKEVAPRGYDAVGLVMANAAARALFAGAPLAEADGRIVIAEGVPDWLTWASLAPRVAVLGITNGAWTAELAARIPAGAAVYIRTHHDKAGERYAATIAASLPGRKLYRSRADAG